MGVQTSFDFDADAVAAAAEPKRRAPRVRGRVPAEVEVQRGVPQSGPLSPSAASVPEADVLPVPETDMRPARPQSGDRAVLVRAAQAAREAPRLTRAELEHLLRRMCGPSLSVVITDNERTMISTRAKGGHTVLRVHHMFLAADPETLTALAGYLTKTDPNAGALLFAFVKRNRARIRRSPEKRIVLRAEGRVHELSSIYDEVNDIYFDNHVEARITWAKQTSPLRRSRRSIKLGSYHSQHKLIRVHPVLDAEWVPRFFVAYIVYHEMLHQVIPPEERGGRREYHSPTFRACERKFAHFDEAIAWEQKHLTRLLRA